MYHNYVSVENLRKIMPDANEYNINKLLKINKIYDQGIDPYPYTFKNTTHSRYILANYEQIEEDAIYRVAGRIMLIRNMGKTIFMNLMDETGSIQMYFNIKLLGTEVFELVKSFEVGDIIGSTGTIFRTKTDEITVRVLEVVLLAKGIRPLPEKFHGIQDADLRQRHRSIDIIMNEEVKQRFINRSKAISTIREFLNSKGYYEMDTPILDTKYGGGIIKVGQYYYWFGEKRDSGGYTFNAVTCYRSTDLKN